MKFSESHEWIVLEGSVARVGISKYAQGELGEIVHIQLPEIGSQVTMGEEVAILESTKSAVDIYSPVSGTIVQVNEKLQNEPGIINKDPESAGWLYKIALSELSELDSLLSFEQYFEKIS